MLIPNEPPTRILKPLENMAKHGKTWQKKKKKIITLKNGPKKKDIF